MMIAITLYAWFRVGGLGACASHVDAPRACRMVGGSCIDWPRWHEEGSQSRIYKQRYQRNFVCPVSWD